jgi:FXSXX-COOH protein
MGETEPGFQSDLIDLSGIDLDRLNDLPSTVFGSAIRRILSESAEDSAAYATFLNDRPDG